MNLRSRETNFEDSPFSNLAGQPSRRLYHDRSIDHDIMMTMHRLGLFLTQRLPSLRIAESEETAESEDCEDYGNSTTIARIKIMIS